MYRFTIRDVLWLTVVVAVLVGWGLSHRQMHKRLMEQTGNSLFFQREYDNLELN